MGRNHGGKRLAYKKVGLTMREITEYDNYKMPPPFKGEMTPEILAEKQRAKKLAEEFTKELREKYGHAPRA